jgi:hypothetical protein
VTVDPQAVRDLVGQEVRISVIDVLLDADGLPLAVDAYELTGVFVGLAEEDER